MKLDIYSTTVKLHPVINPGKKDRRYKSGYRVVPYGEVKTELQFEVINSESRLRIGEIIQVVKYGKYMVIALKSGIPIAMSITNTMDTIVATLRMVRVDQIETSHSFEIPKYLECLSLGFSVGKGSTCG